MAAMSSEEQDWYVTIDGEQWGPYTWAEIRAWLEEGRVSEDDLCWREGFEEWVPIASQLERITEALTPGVASEKASLGLARFLVLAALVGAAVAGGVFAYRAGYLTLNRNGGPVVEGEREGEGEGEGAAVRELLKTGGDAVVTRDYSAARRYYTDALVKCGVDVKLAGLAKQAQQQLQWLDLTEDPSKRFVITNTLVGAKVTLAILDRRDNKEYRVHPGESFAGFLLESYDPATKSAKIYGGFRTHIIHTE